MNIELPKILIVDDETKILNIIQRFLDDLPIQITTARSGEEAIDILKNSKKFAVTISNFYLGMGMNGGKFLKLVKEHSPKTIRILMTSGLSEYSLIESQTKGDFDSFTTKPIVFQNFINQVERSIQAYNNQ
jgi:two-component system, probable response regulator PhcQ